jgi:hypothetical protein
MSEKMTKVVIPKKRGEAGSGRTMACASRDKRCLSIGLL